MKADQMKDMAAFAAKLAAEKGKAKGKPKGKTCPDCGKPMAKCDC
jgi:hypothetical protein